MTGCPTGRKRLKRGGSGRAEGALAPAARGCNGPGPGGVHPINLSVNVIININYNDNPLFYKLKP